MDKLLIKGGTVIDGTGAPRVQRDVLIESGRVRALGKNPGTADKVIDATGLMVIPGIIDPHTHLDAQLLWEPRGTPSCWHGVTSVITGLCGYSLGPVHEKDQDYLLRMFSGVEEMPIGVLRSGIKWSWNSFPDYLHSLDRDLGLNVIPMVGHSTIRYHVMGPEALERRATPHEVHAMRQTLRASVDAGAFGFSTSRSATHNDSDWKPVPSRQADPEELVALAADLCGVKAANICMIPGAGMTGPGDRERKMIVHMAEVSGRPLQLNGFGASGWEMMESSTAKGRPMWAVVGCSPSYRLWTLRELPSTFQNIPTLQWVLEQPVGQRARLFGDPALRSKLRAEVDAEPSMEPAKRKRPIVRWDALKVHRVRDGKNRKLEGRTIKDLGEEQHKHVLDALIDLALSEDLETEFYSVYAPDPDFFSEGKKAQFRSLIAVPMNTDAGAHLSVECRVGEGVFFLRHWVMEHETMSLEEGVRKVTALPASHVGLTDRGVIREGAAADIMVFDPTKLDVQPKERAYDMPGGAMRWIQRSVGVEYVLVNGTPVIWQGQESGELPGKVLRSCWYR